MAWAIDLATGQTLALLQFQAGVQEIFAVQASPGFRFPELIPDDPAVIGNSFLLPLPCRSRRGAADAIPGLQGRGAVRFYPVCPERTCFDR